MADDETVRLQTEVPREQYDRLCNKYPASAAKGKSALMTAALDDLLRHHDLDMARATRQYPPASEYRPRQATSTTAEQTEID